jgi:hypothetical protein
MSFFDEEFPHVELKLLFGELPPILIAIFYLFFILLITLLIYLYILMFDIITQLYNKRNYLRLSDSS